ncbi:MAG: DEAD/DEAH box helicase [Myxococcales bacterium]|nr:DEAD/DEAH box helicase [Myxococcales bacterium]
MAEVARSLVNPKGQAPLTRFHQRLLAEELTLSGGRGPRRLAQALSDARVDLNPHQIEAAVFALDSLTRGGCLLADEVGLGKTIEAALVMAQLIAERKTRLLVLCPATLRAQWQAELLEKFGMDAPIIDGRAGRSGNPFDCDRPVIASIPFGAGRADQLAAIAWDLVVIDEAHRLRNAHRPGHKTGRALKAALGGRPKLLLTATPLQNELSELFGLLTLLDERVLGPEEAFKVRYGDCGEGALSAEAAFELKERIRPSVHRTLRRQVREYVRFTQRRSLVEDFASTPEEHDLYEKVSSYLQRPGALGIERGKRTLLTLVYRKLLASSTFAIAPTLAVLAETLRSRAQSAEGALEPDDLRSYSEEAEEWSDEPGVPAGPAQLAREASELEAYAKEAAGIRINAKGEALKRALDRLFTVARAHGWPEKAAVFTESRRTQQYLHQLLCDHGYRGRICLLCGDAGTPEERRKLVEDFRTHSQVLLSTEAGAEGLNLQFCNIVVNYDLPWNPQRIEQRIGRCHRYGQPRDVLVLNFLNRRNAADARLYELLEKKLCLFDGVFGASDEILGALESGVDFERRVLDIYQSCRLPEEIDAAFAALRQDLERRIDRRMTDARSLLLERFDGEVRRRLKLTGEQAREELAARRRSALAFTSSVLGSSHPDRAEIERAARAVKARPMDTVSYLRLDASTLPARLASLAGTEGWWFAYRLALGGLSPEERLVHLVLAREGSGFRAIPLADSEAFPRLTAREETSAAPPAVSVATAHQSALDAATEGVLREAERRSLLELDVSRERADRYAEDCLLEPRARADRARVAWEAARRNLPPPEDAPARAKWRALLERLERDYRRAVSSVRKLEEQQLRDKDQALSHFRTRAKVTLSRTLVASAYFWLS